MGTVIGGLLLPQFKPYDLGGTLEQANRIAGGQTTNQTALLTLADLKEKQQAEQLFLERIKNDPALAQQLFGTIASLPTTGAQPPTPPATITQRPMGGGGAAQQIPASPDLSQFATQGAPSPGTPTLATLGPQGATGGQPPPAQNPLVAMAAQNPRAAMLMQQQMQAQQDRQLKLEEQRLGMGVKVMEYIARGAQAVKSQEDLEALRQDIARVHPQAAASLPQMYSKEAMEPFIARGTAAADRAKTQLDEAKTRNLDMETRMFPELAKRFGMGDDAQAPAGEPAPATTGAPGADTPSRAAPPAYESAITDANRLYPQVSPTRIKSIIAAESNFDAKAVSSAGAQGPMQLMPGTAKDMGVDDPFDINQNVRGGTRYYAQMLQRYGGDERKALAAYNWGPGNLDKVNGDVSKAPAETQAYVNRVLGGAGGGAIGTAQAPAADPRIAQLEAKIAQRTRDAQIASLMKNESLSTRLNDDANRLTAEKNRLEAPAQEYRKKLATAGLEKDIAASQGRQTEELKQEAEKNRTLDQVRDEKAALYRDRGTGEPVNAAQRYGDVMAQVQQNKVIPLSVKQADNLDKIQGVIPTVRELRQALERVYGPGGIFEKLSPEDRLAASVKGGWARFAQTNPDLAVLGRLIESNVDVVRRALQGQVGTQTEQDAVRGTGAFAKTSGIPDSQEVAYRMMDAFQNMVQGNMRTILRNPQFAHPDLQPTTIPSGLTPAQEALLRKHTTR